MPTFVSDVAVPSTPLRGGPKAKRPEAPEGHAVCFGRGGCGQTKTLDLFGLTKGAANTLCKACVATRARGYTKNAGTEKTRENNLKQNYGMTLADWDELYAYQGGRCFLCRRHESDCPRTHTGRAGNPKNAARNFVVEHDHTDGRVRSLTCAPCNLLVGHLEQVPQTMWGALASPEVIAYLTNPPARIIGVGQRGHHTETRRVRDQTKIWGSSHVLFNHGAAAFRELVASAAAPV